MAPPESRSSPGADAGDLLLVAAGDAAATARLLKRWRSPVYDVFEKSREPAEALEAAAAVFERLLASASKYEPATPFEERLWTLVAREADRAPRAEVPTIPPSRLRESAAARAALLRGAVGALPPGERSAFLLTRVARLSLPLAAAATGASEADLRRRLVRAFTALSESLAPLIAPRAPEPEAAPDPGGAP
ncbi:MAG: sigma factor-like helix-turn-helix DNA-binding protein [Acidithiobacillales bacterium]